VEGEMNTYFSNYVTKVFIVLGIQLCVYECSLSYEITVTTGKTAPSVYAPANTLINLYDCVLTANLPLCSPMTFKLSTREYVPALDLLDVSFNHAHTHIITAWRDDNYKQSGISHEAVEPYFLASFAIRRNSDSADNDIVDANDDVSKYVHFKMETVTNLNISSNEDETVPAGSCSMLMGDKLFVDKALLQVEELLSVHLAEGQNVVCSLLEREQKYSQFESLLLVRTRHVKISS
jgi:hypothetical protein